MTDEFNLMGSSESLNQYYKVSIETIELPAFYIILNYVFIINFELEYLSGLHHLIEL